MTSTIVVDVMGGDNSPEVALEAVRYFYDTDPGVRCVLVGDSAVISQQLDGLSPGAARLIDVVHTDDAITMDDAPASAFRTKTGSSIHTGVTMLADGDADAFFSVGNTGAIVTVSYFTLKLLSAVSRPALAVSFKSFSGRTVVTLDMGVNVDATPDHLFEIARMGDAISRVITGNDRPEVALVNIGREQGKGTSTVVAAFSLLEKDGLNFVGYIEPNRLFDDPRADVVVSDGFTGNVMLKTVEGISEAVSGMFRSTLNDDVFRDIIHNSISRFNYTIYGTAVLLGVNGLVGVGHGRSNTVAFKAGLRKMKWYLDNDIHRRFAEELSHADNQNK